MSKARILANLRDHHGKWVGIHCVLRGLDYSAKVQTDLKELIAEGTVEHKEFNLNRGKWGNTVRLPYYRYVKSSLSDQKVGHLTVVK